MRFTISPRNRVNYALIYLELNANNALKVNAKAATMAINYKT